MSAASSILRTVQGGGLMFWCPGCDGAHLVQVGDGPGQRWGYNGDPVRPTFTPSVLVTYNGPDAGQDQGGGHFAPPAVCQSFVTDGRIHF